MVKTRRQRKADNDLDLISLSSQSKSSTSTRSRMAGTPNNSFSSAEEMWEQLMGSQTLVTMFTAMGELSIGKFDFYGYDADLILRNIMAILNTKKIRKADFFKDLIDIVLVALCRGNIKEDNIERTVDGVAERIRELAGTYGIPIGANREQAARVDGGTLTFARSIMLFPHLASLLLHRCKKLDRQIPSPVLKTNLLPAAMRHSGFSAVIPNSVNKNISAAFKYAHIAYMIDFSQQIDPSLRGKSVMEIYKNQSAFSRVSANNSRYTEECKIQYLIAFGLNKREEFAKIFEVANILYEIVNGGPNLVSIDTLFVNNLMIVGGTEAESSTRALPNCE